MSGLAQVLALLQAVVLIAVGVLEAFRYRDPRWHRIFLIEPGDHRAVRLWVVNVGFYNILMGLACAVGVVLARSDHVAEGCAIVVTVSAIHVLLGGVLLVTQPKLWQNSAGEAGLAAAVVVATLAS
jgi:putative membrane protein